MKLFRTASLHIPLVASTIGESASPFTAVEGDLSVGQQHETVADANGRVSCRPRCRERLLSGLRDSCWHSRARSGRSHRDGRVETSGGSTTEPANPSLRTHDNGTKKDPEAVAETITKKQPDCSEYIALHEMTHDQGGADLR